MLFLTVTSLEECKQQLSSADGIELRLDRFPDYHLSEIKELISCAPCPLLFTLRKKTEQRALVEQLMQLGPAYFDLEHNTPPDFLKRCRERFPKIRLILSYHNFDETPELEKIWQSMQNPSAYAYKIACMARSSLDALRMSAFVRQHPKIIGISMGPYGQLGRILAPVMGNVLNYAAPGDRDFPEAQLSFETLQQIYHFQKLSRTTAVYGLIGDPVDASPSHLTHNQAFRALELNALYVKIPLPREQLQDFIPYLHQLPFRGLSVTMPHKEALLPFLDHLLPDAKAAGAVNTIAVRDGALWGYNTDGLGALDALEKHGSVRGKTIYIIGAGGTARGITYEALKRGAKVTLFNRTATRAHRAASMLGCEGYALDQISAHVNHGYDILINATSAPNISLDKLLSGKIVMDVANQETTSFLEKARTKQCTLVTGRELFIHQAAHQFAIWLHQNKENLCPLFQLPQST